MKFFKELKQYSYYIYFAARANLKAQVAGAYLNWIWWVLEPLGMMVVYSIIFGWFFKQSIAYFPIFIFIGNNIFGFMSKVLLQSVSLVRINQALLSRIYIPKFVLLTVELFINGFKSLIQFGLTVILMIIFRVPVTVNFLWIIPVLIDVVIVTFALGTLFLNWGVFLEDLEHAMTIFVSVWMYFSGVFYEFRSVLDEPYADIALFVNPAACLIAAARDALIYGKMPSLIMLLSWGVIGIALSAIGIRMIYKNENSYIKRV